MDVSLKQVPICQLINIVFTSIINNNDQHTDYESANLLEDS